MSDQYELFDEFPSSQPSKAQYDQAERLIDAIAEDLAEQMDPAVDSPADAVEAVRQMSREYLQAYGIELPDDVFERLVHELCVFNFVLPPDDGGAS
jgi:hypothetical protein